MADDEEVPPQPTPLMISFLDDHFERLFIQCVSGVWCTGRCFTMFSMVPVVSLILVLVIQSLVLKCVLFIFIVQEI